MLTPAPLPEQDAVGINVRLLDEVQSRILSLYTPSAAVTDGGAPAPESSEDDAQHIFAKAVEAALYKATHQLLDDLHRNCHLLGTPERCGTPVIAHAASASRCYASGCGFSSRSIRDGKHALACVVVNWTAGHRMSLRTDKC